MTDNQQPEALRQADWLKKEGASCQRHYDLGVLIERQHVELETLRAKLKTYEDLGNARSDMQLLRMGYAAARLEIESLKVQLAEHASHGQAQDANEHLDLLAQCRSAFPIPERGDPLEVHWAAAMADPGEVPGYLQEIAARHAAQAAPVAVAGPVVNRATVIEWLDANDIEVTDRQIDRLFHFAAPTHQTAPQQDVSAAGGDSFLLLPTRPAPDAPANTAGLSWNAYSGAQMLAYGRACSDAALVVAAPQLSPAAQGDALSDDAVRVPLDSLHADAAYLIGRLREGSMPYARVIEIIRERVDAAKAAIRARAAQEGK